MATKINGNQIQAATRGLVTAWSISEQLNLPPLNQSQINAGYTCIWYVGV